MIGKPTEKDFARARALIHRLDHDFDVHEIASEIAAVRAETVGAIIACLESHTCVSTCCDYQKPGTDHEVIDAIKKHFR